MTPKRPVELFYRHRIWPVYVASGIFAVACRVLAGRTGREIEFLAVAFAAFCIGGLFFGLLFRQKVGIIPLALPSPEGRVRLYRLSIGFLLGGFLLLMLLLT